MCKKYSGNSLWIYKNKHPEKTLQDQEVIEEL